VVSLARLKKRQWKKGSPHTWDKGKGKNSKNLVLGRRGKGGKMENGFSGEKFSMLPKPSGGNDLECEPE